MWKFSASINASAACLVLRWRYDLLCTYITWKNSLPDSSFLQWALYINRWTSLTSPWRYVRTYCGLIFISLNFNGLQFTVQVNPWQFVLLFFRSCKYFPFKFDEWQELYHHAPLNVCAQLLPDKSLSWSLVVNFRPLW